MHPQSVNTAWCAAGTDEDALLGLNFGAYSVRLTGQDVERGTFNHRHAVLYDQKTAARCSSCYGYPRSGPACKTSCPSLFLVLLARLEAWYILVLFMLAASALFLTFSCHAPTLC